MAKRKPLVSIEKDETENGFSMHVLHERPPKHLIYMLLHSSRFPPAFNAGFYKNEKVDELLDKARTTSKEDLRAKYYNEAQKIIVEDAPWIFVDHGTQIVVHRKRLKNFVLSPNFCFEFKQASVE